MNTSQETGASSKGRAMAELDEKLTKTMSARNKLENEINQMRSEIDDVLRVIKSLGVDTLKLEQELLM